MVVTLKAGKTRLDSSEVQTELEITFKTRSNLCKQDPLNTGCLCQKVGVNVRINGNTLR